MPLVPDILPAIDTIRTIGGRLGLRPYTVTVRRRTSARAEPGAAPYADTDTPIVNTATDGTTVPVRVRQVSRQDAIASGGRYTSADFRVGPMTPAYAATAFGAAGGFTDATLDPRPNGLPTQMLWIVNGPSLPKDSIFEKIGEEATAMHYYVILRATGRQD